MNREILFRAWSKKRNVLEEIDVVNGKAVRKGYQWFLADNDMYDSELEQYTGLTDKNGVKIFEGDVVMAEFYGNCRCMTMKEKAKIIFYSNSWCIDMSDYYPKCREGWLTTIKSDTILEVIGNIHEVENEQ